MNNRFNLFSVLYNMGKAKDEDVLEEQYEKAKELLSLYRDDCFEHMTEEKTGE